MSLNYERAGTGASGVLVVHDWMSTLRGYDSVRPFLDESNFSYAFVDLRGYGLSRDLTGTYSAAEAASDLIAVADQIGWERFHVVGHSMSGMIAQRVCVDARARVQSLVAVTPVAASGMPLDPGGLALFQAAVSDDQAWLTIASMVTSGRLPKRWYADRLRAFRQGVSADACLGYLKTFSETDFGEAMTGLKLPAIAVLGRHDFTVFSEESIRRTLGSWLPQLEVEVIESCGHYPMSETPPRFVQILEKFLGGVK